MMLHKFSRFVVGCTILLILAGSFVTSTDSGLSVPDWPTTYGWNMFTFPLSKMVGGIFYEHGHRLIASGVGVLTIGLAGWLWLADPRRWMRWLGVAALGAIVAQGVLGGLTVLFFLPPAVSTAHAGLAEVFFCMTVAIAVFTSPSWNATANPVDDGRLRSIATLTTAAISVQILIGAVMRHTGAGLAIPDFPWMFGHVVPDHWSTRIAVHFAHRMGALIVATAVISTASYIWRRHTDRVELANPALKLMILAVFQVTLGALTVLSHRQVWINSLHVVCGALVLTMSLVITLRSWQVRIADRGLRIADSKTSDAAA
ncbi:MAG TPA: COX15/CtaA family protein [Vicinamibacterales bacterium]|nr:COX15/CtaA family protein [Vicinamibacterales bacterium]